MDLFDDKIELDALAAKNRTTGTNLARILIRHGMKKLKDGAFEITQPDLAPIEEGAAK